VLEQALCLRAQVEPIQVFVRPGQGGRLRLIG